MNQHPMVSLPPIVVDKGEDICESDLTTCHKFFPQGVVSDLREYVLKQLHETFAPVYGLSEKAYTVPAAYLVPFDEKGNISYTESQSLRVIKALGGKGEGLPLMELFLYAISNGTKQYMPASISQLVGKKTSFIDIVPTLRTAYHGEERDQLHQFLALEQSVPLTALKQRMGIAVGENITLEEILFYPAESATAILEREVQEECGYSVASSQPYLHFQERKRTFHGDKFWKDRIYCRGKLGEYTGHTKLSKSEMDQFLQLRLHAASLEEVVAAQRENLLHKYGQSNERVGNPEDQTRKLSTWVVNYIAFSVLAILQQEGYISSAWDALF